MLSVLSRIWTRVAVSISYDDNHYTTGTSELLVSDNNTWNYITLYNLLGLEIRKYSLLISQVSSAEKSWFHLLFQVF